MLKRKMTAKIESVDTDENSGNVKYFAHFESRTRLGKAKDMARLGMI